ncbi:MAG: pepB [Chthoniobacteraceae bacterium]|nr:pepB [Chthoniobacteraceae bacterium]
MKISFDALPAKPGEIAIRFVTSDRRGEIVPAVPEQEFSGQPNSILFFREQETLYIGLGSREKVTASTLRSAAGTAAMFLKKIGRKRLAVHLEEWPQFTGAVVEGLILADYRFEQFSTRKTSAIDTLRVLVLAGDIKAARRDGPRGAIIAGAANLSREIGNQPGNLLYPETLAARAVKMAKENGLAITVLNEARLRAGKFGGLLAVGAGSVRPPRLIVIHHRKGPKNQAPIALVGKAITFDTGGISIKPAADMESMIFDKCGGMAVLGAMAGIAKLGLKRNVVGIIASAENMPGAAAYRPGDIVTTYDGKYIEIINTDAEGRVVLADAIAYARKTCNAAAIVDLATLTGACCVALGEHAAGLWSSDETLGKRVLSASEKTGERLWPMPLYPEYDEQIRSNVALIKNSAGRLGGACTAAAFLKTFAEKTPWAHLDIACTAHRDNDRPDMARGATGFGVRTLIELVESWQ